MRIMQPFQLILWAFAIVLCWEILASATGFEDWIKGMTGRKNTNKALEKQIKDLEARVKELEKKP